MKRKFLITFFVSIVGFALLYSTIFDSVFLDRSTVAIPDDFVEDRDDEHKTPKQKNQILFLLMGLDTENLKKSNGSRTDTIILTKMDFDTGQINMLSLPRDTRVSVKGKQDKLNHAYAYGGKDLAIETVKDFLGIDLEYYVLIDYKIVKEVVDAIGGVKINIPFDMVYTADPPLHINLKKGERTLNGKEAHDFLRWRNNNDKSVGYKDGDIGRIQAQQYFMKELIKQTLKTKNLLRLPKLVETYFENVETNIPINLMLKGAASAKKIDVDNIMTNTIPGSGEYIGGISYYIPNKQKTESMIKDMFEEYID